MDEKQKGKLTQEQVELVIKRCKETIELAENGELEMVSIICIAGQKTRNTVQGIRNFTVLSRYYFQSLINTKEMEKGLMGWIRIKE